MNDIKVFLSPGNIFLKHLMYHKLLHFLFIFLLHSAISSCFNTHLTAQFTKISLENWLFLWQWLTWKFFYFISHSNWILRNFILFHSRFHPGDKPAAMKHSNQSTIVNTKSSAHSLMHNLLLLYSSLWLIAIVYLNRRAAGR